MYIRKSREPRTLPCGISLRTSSHPYYALFTTTLLCLLVRNASFCFKILPPTSTTFNFNNSLQWETVSNAFSTIGVDHIYTAFLVQGCLEFLKLLHQLNEAKFVCPEAIVVSVNGVVCSRYLCIWFLIIFSDCLQGTDIRLTG